MGEAIGQSLPLAIGVAISPMPIVAVVLMLVTPRARTNGPAFLIGWLAGVGILGAILLVVADPAGASHHGAPATWVSWVELGLGLLLLAVAVRQWQHRPHAGDDVAAPKWMSALDTFTPARSLAVAAALAAVNPKNLLLIVAGAAAVAQTGASSGDQVVAWVVFTIVASIGVGAPVAIFFSMGDRAAHVLDELKTWMATNNVAIMAVVCLVIAAKLVGDGIAGLST
ncbi:MAG TPA: GAP family protein [Baekduia sp.]|uniref:GAP family protein n=1 Tax=Baekduia sp. TaxID=2600305 RepID=UPI002D7807F1|nr:GAP family protein [Baekduia sp.]HET6510325.1 GAP family protein [Baekduia sp.]